MNKSVFHFFFFMYSCHNSLHSYKTLTISRTKDLFPVSNAQFHLSLDKKKTPGMN